MKISQRRSSNRKTKAFLSEKAPREDPQASGRRNRQAFICTNKEATLVFAICHRLIDFLNEFDSAENNEQSTVDDGRATTWQAVRLQLQA